MKGKGFLILTIGILLLIALLVFQKQELKETIVETSESGFVAEDIELVKSRQIITLYEKVKIDNLGDLKSEELCSINFNKDKILSDEVGTASFSFDESLVGKSVFLSCDQFERFGISQDELMKTKIISAIKLDEGFACDYGRVTTPTVYFWFVSSQDLDKDYCVAPLTVLPLEKDEGSCFSDDEINAMRDECEAKDEPSFEISDANGCSTIYCGWKDGSSLCPSESLLGSAEDDCVSQEGTAVRYSEEISGQDFPCAQIRCSMCPTAEKISEEEILCEKSEGVSETRFDYESGCEYTYCVASEEREDTSENEGTQIQEEETLELIE
jgi:hypothetical protein